MYKCNDYVIRACGGVWQVDSVDKTSLHLRRHPHGERRTVPADKNDIIRAAVSKQELLDIISRIGFIRTIQAPNDKTRKELYENAMAKYSELEWVQIIKSVYLREQDGRLMTTEPDYAKKAKDYFHSEISAVLEIEENEVEAYLCAAVSKDDW